VHCLRTLGKGAYFGEISLVAGRERVATAVATPGTILMAMDKKTFLALFMERRTILTELRLKLLPPDVPIPLILVLQHSRGYTMLLRFLKKELAQENILFWKEVDRLEEFIRTKIRWVKSSRPNSTPDAVMDFDQPIGSDYTVKIAELHRPLLIIAERVGQIVDKFVHTNSPLQINIPDGMCKELLANYDKYFSEGMSACSGEVDVAGAKAATAGPPPAKLDPTERNARNITKVLCSRSIDAPAGVVDSEQDMIDKKRREAIMEIKEESLEEQEQKQASTAVSLHSEESKEELPAVELVEMLEMLLQMFTRAKREVLLMLGHDGYKRWQDTKTYAEFRALITPYVGVPEGHVNQISENTKEMFVQVDMENAK
jgi:CRP-like cAMP-binding protein